MSGKEPAGVAFPASADGRRSTSALGQAVVTDALARVDPPGALEASRETNWRTGYLTHFRRLIEAGLISKQAAVSVARDGLASLHRRMRVVGHDGTETGLDALVSAKAQHRLATVTVTGTGTAETELSVPYHGERLNGSALLRRLDAWVAAGVIEPSCADAVRAVAASPEWLALPGRTVVVLGADGHQERTFQVGLTFVDSIAWSPDGSQFVLTGSNGGIPGNLYVIDADGLHLTTLHQTVNAPSASWR